MPAGSKYLPESLHDEVLNFKDGQASSLRQALERHQPRAAVAWSSESGLNQGHQADLLLEELGVLLENGLIVSDCSLTMYD